MRSNVFFLTIGLIADSALAGPCKPRTSGAVTTSVVATSEPTSTALSTATEVLPDTTTLELSTTAATADTTTVASEAETTTTDITTTAAADTTTIASEAETTTTADITTTTAPESTSTAPESTPTYHIVGGSGSVNNAPIQGISQDGTLVLINPTVDGLAVRSYTLDTATGRLQDTASGNYLCAYYLNSPSTSSPAFVANCQTGTTGPNNYYDYLNCQIVSGTVSCTAPKAYCTTDDDTGLDNCVTVSGEGVNNQFYYQHRSSGGDYLFISTGSPSGYTPTSLMVQQV
ncbi:uncharacterized protein BKA55DRAFT_639301 [Fusarium redolens]|uniref:Uncharacterized protein n=1 Tax=Fusarium redolens TaxID=48865 RepID=A0A9P9KFB1_FUSRE|nr:uncharacterized protein BKA55DRAFT_639301 [Fusarium redolens]KAH7259348.1 hypothetical protein BKA55DRAFT_639301 [Fusarium redolens]